MESIVAPVCAGAKGYYQPERAKYLAFFVDADEADFWNTRKADAERLASKLRLSSLTDSYGQDLEHCCASLSLLRDPETKKLKIKPFSSCKRRWCPICAARKAKRAWVSFANHLDRVVEQNPHAEWAMLTLTIKNVPLGDLREAVQHLTRSWRKMTLRKPFKKAVLGWVRSVEVTFKDEMAHPHIHVLLMLEPDYFSKSKDLYISTAQWAKMWKMSAELDYDPICDARKTKPLKNSLSDLPEGKAKALGGASEVMKYLLKPVDLRGSAERVQLIANAIVQLKNQRLIASGGLLSGCFVDEDDDEEVQLQFPEMEAVAKFNWWHTVKHYIRGES